MAKLTDKQLQGIRDFLGGGDRWRGAEAESVARIMEHVDAQEVEIERLTAQVAEARPLLQSMADAEWGQRPEEQERARAWIEANPEHPGQPEPKKDGDHD